MKRKFLLWGLIIVAAGTAFYLSFKNSIEMASASECDDGKIVRVEKHSGDGQLFLKISYTGDVKSLRAILVDSSNTIIAQLGAPDEEGNVPAISNVPRGEKYLWVGFPQLKSDGKPVSLLIKNPLYEGN